MLFLHRKVVAPASRRLLSSSPPPLYGGYDEATFKYIAESISPFISNFLKPTVTNVSFGRLTMELPVNTGNSTKFRSFFLNVKSFSPDFIGSPIIPCLHGGISAAIIDHCGGFCAWTVLREKTLLVNTADMRIDYIRPAPVEKLICDAKVVRG